MTRYRVNRAIPAIAAALVTFPVLLAVSPVPGRGEAAVMAAAFALLAGLVLFFAGGTVESAPMLFFLGAALAAGFAIRTCSLPQSANTDYIYCLGPWAQDFRDNGWRAIVSTWSDYNVPYLYIIGIIARVPMNDLYLYKLVSVIFDCGVVLAGMRLARVFSLSPLRKTVLASALFLAPTVWLNSSFWGQCDSIYAFFCVMALVFALEDKPARSVAMAAVAFSFKLQAVFFLPVFIILWMVRRVSIREIPVFIGTFFLTVLPAWILGRPLSSILLIYRNQTQTYASRLNLNSPSAYALAPADERFHDALFNAGLALAFCYLGALLLLAWVRRGRIGNRALLLFVAAMVIGIPWLLPSMHDRYFYLADIFCVFLAVLIPEKWVFAPLCIFCSYAGYHAYLFSRFIPYVGLAVPSLVMLFLMGGAVMLLLSELRRPEPV
ncbi:MAG: hypothetical protein LBH95_07810 [Oscillospiraceae bacterium]|nr:hypothetical protein [Oscillospiraceae bacterium]